MGSIGMRRRYAYFGVGLLAFWTLGTYYLAIVKTSPSLASPDLGRQLSARIGEVEAEVARQKAANHRLLELLHNSPQQPPEPAGPSVGAQLDAPIAVLVIACNRPNAIKKHLETLLRLRPSATLFPIIVSQDCGHEETRRVIQSFGANVTLISHPDTTEITLPPKQKKFLGYYKLNRHYKWALNQTFFNMKYKTAIVTEDDLDIAVDFFEYFSGTYPLLRVDASLWCVSAWNDNGKRELVDAGSPERLRRTDLFPGLGWMLRAETWAELEPKWPIAFWDDWMRKPEQRKGRACIRPEISRTAMSKDGKVGVSRGLFFEKHLKHILLNTVAVPFSRIDLSYLLKETYDPAFVADVYAAPSITQTELAAKTLNSGAPFPTAVRLTYDNKNTFKATAKNFGLMDDYRAGVARTAYRGVVEFMQKGTRVYLAPEPTWTGYDPTWT